MGEGGGENNNTQNLSLKSNLKKSPVILSTKREAASAIFTDFTLLQLELGFVCMKKSS